MKKKISRILGVVLTLALLSSLCITAAPVAASTHSWTALSRPSAIGLVLDPGNMFTGPFDISINGTDIYASSDVGGLGAALVQSQDGGRTWAVLIGFPGVNPAGTYYGNAFAPGTITDIVCSSIDANTVYVTDGVDVWKTLDGGVNWQPITNLFQYSITKAWARMPGGTIVALDIGYTAVGPHVFAAVNSFGGGNGGVYVCNEWEFGVPWYDMDVENQRPNPWGLLNADVADVKVDPTNFAATQMVMALAWNSGIGGPSMIVTTKFGGMQWAVNARDVALPGVTSWPMTGTLWLPSNFSPNPLGGNMQAFVGLTTWTPQGDVYLAIFYPAVPPTYPSAPGFDLNIAGPGTNTNVTGLDGEGSTGSCALLAVGQTTLTPTVPTVFSSINGGATWLLNVKRPTGGVSVFGVGVLASVLVMPGYLTSGTAIVGTHGTDCGVSITQDFGATWNTISLINTSAFMVAFGVDTIQDFATCPDGTVFVSTDSGFNGVDSVWRFASNWERVYSGTLVPGPPTFDPEFITVTPDGSAVFLADNDGPYNLYRTLDNGQIWLPQVSAIPGGAIPSWLAVDANTVLVGGVDVVYETYTNGSFWMTRQVFPAATGTVIQSLAVSPNPGDLLAAGVTGAGVARVARSQDNGLTWTPITAPVPFSTAGAINVIVEFSYGYDGNLMILATGTDVDGDAGLFRYDYDATVPAWQRIDNSLGTPPSATVTPAPIVTAPDSFTMRATILPGTGGDDTFIDEPGLPQITVVVTTEVGVNPTTVTYSVTGNRWTIVFGDVGDIVTVTAVNNTSGSASGTINPMWGNCATVAIAVGADADGDAIIPVGTLLPLQTASYVLPDILSTTTQPPSTVTTPYNVSAGIGLVSAPGGPQGMVYAMDSGDSASRIKTFDSRKASQVGAELMAGPTGVTFGAGSLTAAGGLWYAPGSNVLYAIGMTALGPRIYTYTDYLNVAGTGVAASAITTGSAVISWNDLPNASGYTVVINATPPATAQASNFFTAATDAGITVTVNASANTAAVGGLSSSTTYYVSVWGTRSGVSSFLFGGALHFTTLPMVPVNLIPVNGATDVALLPSFGWSAVPGAVSYDFELGIAPDFSGATAVTTTATFLTWETELLYDQNYYWRVRAVTAAGVSAWCESNFHTRVEAIPPITVEPAPTPTIILPTPTVTVIPPDIDITVEPPDITVDLPQPTTIITTVQTTIEMPEEVTPAYIWAIVAIGALLVIAVIILIIRTRRVV